MIQKSMMRIVALAVVFGVCSHAAHAQTITGQDDFGTDFDANGVPIGGNQIFKSRVASPDNQGNQGFGGAPGTFGGSFFDYFGISDRRINFDVSDDSNNGFAQDQFGFAVAPGSPGDCVNFLVLSDVDNPQNPNGAFVTMDWEFDIVNQNSNQDPYNVHCLCFEAVAYGDFETDDQILISGGIDALDKTIADFTLSAAQDNSDILYTVTMEAGATYDFYFDPFFSAAQWDDLIANGPSGTLTYHPDDNAGPGDDGVAFNGFIAEPTANNSQGGVTRAYSANGFDDQEFRAYKDPLFDQVNGAQLGKDKQKFQIVCKGTGDCFQLQMFAVQNSTNEVFAMDNIVLKSAVLGDANGDGVLDFADIEPFVLALFDPQAYQQQFGVEQFVIDINCDGTLDFADIEPFVDILFGN